MPKNKLNNMTKKPEDQIIIYKTQDGKNQVVLYQIPSLNKIITNFFKELN